MRLLTAGHQGVGALRRCSSSTHLLPWLIQGGVIDGGRLRDQRRYSVKADGPLRVEQQQGLVRTCTPCALPLLIASTPRF